MPAFAYLLPLPSSWFCNSSFFIISVSTLSRFPKTSPNKRGECKNHKKANWPEKVLFSFGIKDARFLIVSSIFLHFGSESKFYVHAEISERERRPLIRIIMNGNFFSG